MHIFWHVLNFYQFVVSVCYHDTKEKKGHEIWEDDIKRTLNCKFDAWISFTN